jgi:GcrA cell cycle regulator
MIQDNRWTPEQDAELRRLWDNGLTASRICSAMGLYSRSQVIGRAHRLKLPRRLSPIKRSDGPRIVRLRKERVMQAPKPQPHLPGRIIPFRLGPVTKCRWPEGDPKHPDFKFCECKTLPGHSYCHDHYVRAYQPRLQAAE